MHGSFRSQARGIGFGFHGDDLYYTTMAGGFVKAADDDVPGVYGETTQGELSVELVRGIPVGDYAVGQIQIAGDPFFVGIGRRTMNGRSGPLSDGVIDDHDGRDFVQGGKGSTGATRPMASAWTPRAGSISSASTP